MVCMPLTERWRIGEDKIHFSGLSPFETTHEDQEVALVGGLHPAFTYIFRIFAMNSIDSSSPTEPVVAKTQEEGKFCIAFFLLSIIPSHLICNYHISTYGASAKY